MRITTTVLGVLCSTFLIAQVPDQALLTKAYEENNPYKSIELLKEIESTNAFGDSLLCLYNLTFGIAHGKLGKADSALFYLNQSLSNSSSKGYEFLNVRAGNAKGLVFFQSGKLEEAVEAYQGALVLAEANKFREQEATILGNLGGVYFQMANYPLSIKYSKESLDIAYDLNDEGDISYGHLRLAVVFEETDSLSKSIFHNTKASLFAESVENYVLLTYIEKTLGNIHRKLGRLDSSLYHHRRARKFATIEGEQENLVSTINEIAKVLFEMGDLKEAKKEAVAALELADKNRHPFHATLAYDVIYQIALKRELFKEALEARNQYVAINDSLNAVDMKERIAELEIQYETARKEKEIVEANSEIERRERFQTFLYVIIGTILFFATIGILLLVQRFKLKRALLSQEIDTLRAQINSVFGESSKKLDLSLEQINEGLFKPLSEREFEILNEAISDKTNKEISDAIFVSVNTVKSHLKNIYTKLGVSNRKDALALLLKHNQ